MYKKSNSSRLLATLSSALLISSCAGPESYQQKMARYEPKSIGKNQVPEIKTSNFQFKSSPKLNNTRVERSPASNLENKNTDVEGKESNPTNKKLYFLTLYNEYQSLKNYSPEFSGPTLSICPNFHTGLLKYNEKAENVSPKSPINKKFTYDSNKYNDELYVASKPELLLPVSKEEITPRVIDIIKSSSGSINEVAINDLVHKAIEIHLSKTYSEISELCEYGVSDNYYIYENLITHIKNNKFEANNKNMNILLKTTLFSNMALMNSIGPLSYTKSGRSIASVTSFESKPSYENEVITRLNVTWANQYFNFIKQSH